MARLSFALLTATLSTIFILGPTVASAQFAAGYDPQCVITCWDLVLQDQSARLVDEGIFAVGQSAWCTDDTLTGALSSCWDQACVSLSFSLLFFVQLRLPSDYSLSYLRRPTVRRPRDKSPGTPPAPTRRAPYVSLPLHLACVNARRLSVNLCYSGLATSPPLDSGRGVDHAGPVRSGPSHPPRPQAARQGQCRRRQHLCRRRLRIRVSSLAFYCLSPLKRASRVGLCSVPLVFLFRLASRSWLSGHSPTFSRSFCNSCRLFSFPLASPFLPAGENAWAVIGKKFS